MNINPPEQFVHECFNNWDKRLGMKKLIMPLSFLLLLVGCTDDKWRETWVLENLLDEEVKITIMSSKEIAELDSRGYSAASYTLTPKETVVLQATTVFGQDAPPSAHGVLRSFFQSISPVISGDSMVLEFNNEKYLHFKVDDIFPQSPLNPYNSNSTTSAWTTTELEKDNYEVRFKIGRQHKEAAN